MTTAAEARRRLLDAHAHYDAASLEAHENRAMVGHHRFYAGWLLEIRRSIARCKADVVTADRREAEVAAKRAQATEERRLLLQERRVSLAERVAAVAEKRLTLPTTRGSTAAQLAGAKLPLRLPNVRGLGFW